MKNKTELKSCPFCGGKARLCKQGHREYGPTYSVECVDCFITTRPYAFTNRAVEDWNRRTEVLK